MSGQNSLNAEDMKKWLYNTFLFSIPALIVFLSSLQGNADLKIALGAFLQALCASLIDLLRKFKQGA